MRTFKAGPLYPEREREREIGALALTFDALRLVAGEQSDRDNRLGVVLSGGFISKVE